MTSEQKSATVTSQKVVSVRNTFVRAKETGIPTNFSGLYLVRTVAFEMKLSSENYLATNKLVNGVVPVFQLSFHLLLSQNFRIYLGKAIKRALSPKIVRREETCQVETVQQKPVCFPPVSQSPGLSCSLRTSKRYS